MADQAWHAGPDYRDIASLFNEARDRLAPRGYLYVLLSTNSDLELLEISLGRQDLRPGSSLRVQSSLRHY